MLGSKNEVQVLGRLLHEADQREGHGQADGHEQAADQQHAIPLDVPQARQQHRERDVEEDLVLDRLDETK
jgi:hypothetical protein